MRRTHLFDGLKVASLMVLSLLPACHRPLADPLARSGSQIVWPGAPDPARLRYLTALKSEEDIVSGKTFAEQWHEIMYGPKPPSVFVSPYAVAVHDDGFHAAVVDTSARCVHLFDLKARTYQHMDSPGDPRAPFECPVAAEWVGDVLWVADAQRHGIAIVDNTGGARWVAADALVRPAGLAFCPANGLCYVSDAGTHRLVALNPEGRVVFEIGSHGAGPGQFNRPSHLDCAMDGTIVVADSLNSRVQRLNVDGTPIGLFGRRGDAVGDLSLPKGVAVAADGNIWVVDAHFENVQAFTPEGKLLLAVGHEGTAPGEFWLPSGLCIDRQGRMWVADTGNHRVQVFELVTP